MPQNGTLTTEEALAFVHELLERPPQEALSSAKMVTEYWLQLNGLELRAELSDRTLFLSSIPFTVGIDLWEYQIGDIPNFGQELALEVVAGIGTVGENTTKITLASDSRTLLEPTVWLMATIFRDPNNPGIISIRFDRKLPGTYTFRLWFKPSSFGRPGLQERHSLPQEAQSLLLFSTAQACRPALEKAVGMGLWTDALNAAIDRKLDQNMAKFETIYQNWVEKDTSGPGHRTAFNEFRRGQGRYGARRFPGSGGPSGPSWG